LLGVLDPVQGKGIAVTTGEVSERLGHATVAFTLDTYAHIVPGLQEAAAKAFDDFLSTTKTHTKVLTTD